MYLRWELAGTEKISNPALQLNPEFDLLSLEEHSSLLEWVSGPRHVGSGALIWEARHFVLTSILPWLTLEAGKCKHSKRPSWKTSPWTEREVCVWQPKLCRITFLEVHGHHVCLEHYDRQDQQPHTCLTWRPPHPSCPEPAPCMMLCSQSKEWGSSSPLRLHVVQSEMETISHHPEAESPS